MEKEEENDGRLTEEGWDKEEEKDVEKTEEKDKEEECVAEGEEFLNELSSNEVLWSSISSMLVEEEADGVEKFVLLLVVFIIFRVSVKI